ncbi:hypothetical protein FRX31_032706 [Thalictrum thalictroides]|uniref:Transmembrane protein n=1 Tax=Thalictrum thalictroides TaxID=46969 RepID=A0A7J6UYG6_THATH|nr:hypothetical protein FRX31_032706 [Thalictrum thalictroides]
MKMFGAFSVLFMVVGVVSLLLAFTTATSSLPADVVLGSNGNCEMIIIHSRKLKEKGYNPSIGTNEKKTEKVNLEDYHPIDPVPSSKAAITNGPIEHGSPLMPYIPKPTPASPPRHGSP